MNTVKSVPHHPVAHRLSASLMILALSLVPLAAPADVGDAVTIASGLANPRGIAFAPNGDLFVAEAGTGGPGPCIPSPSAPVDRCYGETGALTRVVPGGGVERILTGLPSLALVGSGLAEGGAVDVSFHGMSAYVVLGAGGDPAFRDSLGGKGRLLGHILKVTPSGQYKVIADVSGHESRFNPAGGAIDSNPYGIISLPGRWLVADAGANALIEVLANKKVKTFAIPPAGPNGQSVPTSIAAGPDGGMYVGLLTGFPFFQGTAQVLRYESDGSGVASHVTGLTAVVDVAFDNGGALYILEIASGQVGPPTPPMPGLGNGRLKRQCPGGTPEVLLGGLTFAAGVAIGPDDAAYLTNFSTSPTNGEVLRLPLEACP